MQIPPLLRRRCFWRAARSVRIYSIPVAPQRQLVEWRRAADEEDPLRWHGRDRVGGRQANRQGKALAAASPGVAHCMDRHPPVNVWTVIRRSTSSGKRAFKPAMIFLLGHAANCCCDTVQAGQLWNRNEQANAYAKRFRHLGRESNTRCPAPQLRSGIDVDEEILNEKAALVNGPRRREAARGIRLESAPRSATIRR
jgi:hypothetical protein